MKLSENVRGMAKTPKNVDRCYLNNIADSIETMEDALIEDAYDNQPLLVPSDDDFVTLRDQLAMAALQGQANIVSNASWKSVSESCYAAADAMMEARK